MGQWLVGTGKNSMAGSFWDWNQLPIAQPWRFTSRLENRHEGGRQYWIWLSFRAEALERRETKIDLANFSDSEDGPGLLPQRLLNFLFFPENRLRLRGCFGILLQAV